MASITVIVMSVAIVINTYDRNTMRAIAIHVFNMNICGIYYSRNRTMYDIVSTL